MSSNSNKRRRANDPESYRSKNDKKPRTPSPTEWTDIGKTPSPTGSEELAMINALTLSSPDRPSLRKISPVPYLLTTDPLIQVLGLERLNKDGYINLDSVSKPDPGFGYGKHTTPAVAYRTYKKTNTIDADGEQDVAVGEDSYIHPIFFRDRWETQELASSSSPYWEELKPVWQLATLLLEEKVMSGYIMGMLDRSSHTEIKTRFDGHAVHWFQCKERPSKQELWLLWEDLWDLKNCIKWSALEITEERHRGVSGTTKVDRSVSGLSKHGVGSKIVINENVLSILCGRINASDFSKPWSPGTDNPSARLRLQWSLATTMVHELMHALWLARHGTTSIEPFFRDTRFSELGWQWETLIYGGAIAPTSNRCEQPYGLQIQNWPGGITHVRYPTLQNVGPEPPKIIELFPVEMSWVADFFKQSFWDFVERYGRPGIICPVPAEGVPFTY
ncbi:hypothetical protein D6D26_09677 [Aureobasidium pullulans]|nr:hypothetical protein D6D26_09677 [Aureobasidium pullulans]